jgi:HSP20 family protein
MSDSTAVTKQEQEKKGQAVSTEPRPRPIRPPVDVFENEQSIVLHADLPGVAQDGLHVSVEGRVLTIEASASLPTPEDMKVAYAEFRTPQYRREFTLSGELDTGKIDASLRNGLLTLTIPKQEHAKPKKIEVSVH